MSLVFVDCEAFGGSPVTGALTEFGAVAYGLNDTVAPHCQICSISTRPWFHGVVIPTRPSLKNPAVPEPLDADSARPGEIDAKEREVLEQFGAWLKQYSKGQPVFVSDNPAFDFQWLNCAFWKHFGRNPFGHSGRRISDFYAGLTRNWHNTQVWKQLRAPVPHDHNPVHDALGNLIAFEKILRTGQT